MLKLNKTRTLLAGSLAGLALAAQAQTAPPPAPGPTLRTSEAATSAMPSDEQSYRRETVFGVNFNTQAGLIGGVNVRVARVLDDRWLRFWSLEGVAYKSQKEESITTVIGGAFKPFKANYAFALRPSFGVQRVLFRKAADAGVQVNGLLSAGPSLGLLMPYYITYDETIASGGRGPGQADIIVDEQYDPSRHPNLNAILDRAPLFSGVGGTTVVPGGHVRLGLSFEYGRYRDAVAGAEVGFLLEGYTKRLQVFNPDPRSGLNANDLNRQFYPAVYLCLYLGHRS